MNNHQKFPSLPGLPDGVAPYDWALRQLRVSDTHRTGRDSKDIVVALIDIGYRHHPYLDGHLWENPRPTRGDIHGWDFADDDASLEYNGPVENVSQYSRDYYRGHHVFVAGEIASISPESPIMPLRVDHLAPGSWVAAIRYAVDHGARILVIPHGYVAYAPGSKVPLIYQGSDFTFPWDNPEYRQALDYAYDNGCLIFAPSSYNFGRRMAFATSGFEAVCSVGSCNKYDEPADICCPADYTELGAPGGQRHTEDVLDRVWGCGGEQNYISFTGGCMACSFAGGVAALVWSKYPKLPNEAMRQILRNTARPARGTEYDAHGWEPSLGYGIIDPSEALSLDENQLCRDIRLVEASVKVWQEGERYYVDAALENLGVYDAEKATTTVYTDDPIKAANPNARMEDAVPPLQIRQIGHTVTRVRGLHIFPITIALTEKPTSPLWFETFCLDRHDTSGVQRYRLDIQMRD